MQTVFDEEPHMKILNGRALLNSVESRLMFVHNPPRGPRSKEVGRTKHARIVRRPDGLYTVTIRFDAREKLILSALLSEVRRLQKYAADDLELVKAEQKRKEEE